MIGNILVDAATLFSLVSIILYLAYRRNHNPTFLFYARTFFVLTFVDFLATAGFFLSLILTHQFQYTYVWSYSSRELSLPLLISTFYAGQEGSFMLWTFYTLIFGMLLLRHSSRNGYEPEVMAVYGLIELALFVMLLVKSPFRLVWESFPGQVNAGFLPADGRGLNPLLQNYWMVIHPQVLFSGFASMGVPYAYAVAAIKRDYKNWFRPATPWLVTGSLILGTGIMMGGFWAYETLGWGGYWGWDPVENSSLIPWICSIAGLHMILSQRRTGRFARTSLLLGILCFLMVVYSTFLTRSGVLGETSVHSFVDPGMLVYWLLVGMIVVFTALGLGYLVARWKEIASPPLARQSYMSREFALFLGSVTLLAIALFVVVGTSAPLITDLLYGKKSAMDTSFYSGFALPLGVLLSLLSGIAQLLWWSRSSLREVTKLLLPSIVVAVLATAILALNVPVRVPVALFIGGALFSLLINLQVGWRIVKGNPKYAAGALAHVGLAIMFLGFVASSEFDEKHTVSLEQGVPQKVMGYDLTYVGYRGIGNEKYAFQVHVSDGSKEFTVAPVMFYSQYNDGLMRTPDIRNLFTKDFYLAPLSLEQASAVTNAGIQQLHLTLGETKKVGKLAIKFVDFDFPENQRAAMMEGQDVQIGVQLEVLEEGHTPVTLVPRKLMHKGEMTDQPAALHGNVEFTVASMHPDQTSRENSSVDVSMKDLVAAAAAERDAAGKGDVLIVEASIKPFINLVWSGLIVLLAGLVVTIVRRSQESRTARKGEAVSSRSISVGATTTDAGSKAERIVSSELPQ